MSKIFSVLSAAMLFAAGCATTQMLSTWKDPTQQLSDMRRVLIIAPSQDSGIRRAAEDELARKVPGGVPSYTVIADDELDDEPLIKSKVTAGGFDGVVVFRVVSVEKEATWVPGNYGTYYGYGVWGYDPGYLRTDTFVRVDTNIYKASNGKLAWASSSRTEDPESVQELVSETADAVSKEIRKHTGRSQ